MFKSIKHFKGLDSLRFFAAYLVVIHHAEQIRMTYGLFNLKQYSLFNNGGLAVTFFFVLSGFLISYLLLKEQFGKGTISVKKFYFRRVLRIWPLYFLLILIGTLLLPYILDILSYNYIMPYNFNDVVWYYIFFTPFLVNVFYGHHLLEPLLDTNDKHDICIMRTEAYGIKDNNNFSSTLNFFEMSFIILLFFL